MNTYRITRVNDYYKVEDTASGDAYYFPRIASVLRTSDEDVLIENTNMGVVGLKSIPYTQILVGAEAGALASAQATIDAIAVLA